jgi:hypothetical protein
MRKKASDKRSRLNRHGRLAAFALVGLLAITACYPGEITSVGQLDVVVTTHDETVNFASFQTFAIPDTVIQLGADSAGAVDLQHDFDDIIIADVVQELEDMGYVRELDPATNGADFVVLATAVASREIEVYQSYPWYGYWGWYPGWGYPGWGYGSGWGYYYPPTLSATSYEQGTLFIDILDVNNPDASAQDLPIAWTAAIRGVLGTSGSVTQARLVTAIDRAFDQSPYLGR